MRRGGMLLQRLRERLFVSAVVHLDSGEENFAHDLRKGFLQRINQHQLADGGAATGVTHVRTWQEIHTNGAGVGGSFAVENLRNARKFFLAPITREAVDSESGGM